MPWTVAALVALALSLFPAVIWLASSSKPNPRNNPDTLLAANRSTKMENLPGPPEAKMDLSPADLAFGEEQIARMVRDRPELARYVSKTDAVWQFCAMAFAGATIGEHIVWDNSPPTGDYRSDHQGPYQGRSGYVRIRRDEASGSHRGQPLSCEELWSCAVFEIENMRNHKAFAALYEMAVRGELSREEWIRENSRLEYGALKRTAKDYAGLWQPLAMTRAVSSTRALWGVGTPPTFEIWISLYRDPDSYPWDVFGQYYDREIVPYVRSTRGFQGVPR